MSDEHPRVRVDASPVRCPYCHVDVDPASEAWVACAGCLARHHAACWQEEEACGACRGTRPLAPGVEAPRERKAIASRDVAKAGAPPARLLALLAGAGLVALLAVGLLFLLTTAAGEVVVVRPAEPSPTASVPAPTVELTPAPPTDAEPTPAPPTGAGGSRLTRPRLVGVLGDSTAGLELALGSDGGRPALVLRRDGRAAEAPPYDQVPFVAVALASDALDQAVALRPGGELTRYEVASGRALSTLPGPSAARAQVAFGGRIPGVLTRGEDGALSVWDPDTGALVRRLQGPAGEGAIALSRDGDFALVGGRRFTLVRLGEDEPGRDLAAEGEVRAVAFAGGNDAIMAGLGDGGRLTTWDIPARTTLHTVLDGAPSPRRIAVSGDGALLAIASETDELELWSLAPRRARLERLALSAGWGEVSALAFEPGGGALVLATRLGYVVRLQVGGGR